MKKTLLISLSVFMLYLGTNVLVARAQAPLSVSSPKLADVVPGVLYIQLKARHGIDFDHLSPSHTGNAVLDDLFAAIGVTKIAPFDPDAKNYAVARRHGIDRMYVINFSDEGRSPHLLCNDFAKLDVVENASPRFIFQKCVVPNDPQIASQYALDNSHMHILDAWGVSEGNANIIIADCDEGVNYNHEDLAAHIFKLGEFFGYDIVGDSGTAQNFIPDNDPMPGPNQSHGTFTSGCFGAVPDNGLGGAGSGFNCRIMAIKIADNLGNLYGGYEGIQYAVTHGAKIINCSWGSPNAGIQEIAFAQNFVYEALDTGALIVAAAGNDGVNIDLSINHFIPAYLNGVLSVGATDEADKPASFTNFGKTVDVFAPGTDIFSTSFPGNNAYNSESGTSFSCPLTAGVAGLIWAKNPAWTPKFVARQIIQTCDNVVKPTDRAHYWGRVNAFTALTTQTVPGLEITDFTIDGVDHGGLHYVNKEYTIEVTFKNYMANGTGIQAQLIPVPGTITSDPTLPAYTVQQAISQLGAMTANQQTAGAFKFTRDTNDDGLGGQLPMGFVISYGSATVGGQKYFDTLLLNVDITGDNAYPMQGVSSANSNRLQLLNSYPNPVSGKGIINFELAEREYAKLSICDVLGRTVSILSEGISDIGDHTVHFDAHALENGVYVYKLETSDGAVITKRIIVIH